MARPKILSFVLRMLAGTNRIDHIGMLRVVVTESVLGHNVIAVFAEGIVLNVRHVEPIDWIQWSFGNIWVGLCHSRASMLQSTAFTLSSSSCKVNTGRIFFSDILLRVDQRSLTPLMVG